MKGFLGPRMLNLRSIAAIVEDLIAISSEGDYWDFKRLPHSNNADLLHDIICLANSLARRPKYLIIGVTDPADGCEVIGLDANTPNRKKQHDYINFLRDKSFAGDLRPGVQLHSIQVKGKQIDVLQIDDSREKPYFLTKNYQGVRAYHIYTRVGDTNTPKDKSADIYHLEKLWRQRFGIDLPPIERFSRLMEEAEFWNIKVGNTEYSHHSIFPEYQIRFCKTHEGKETYSYYYPNTKSFFGTAHLMYFSTVLKEIGYCGVDEFRIPLVTPSVEAVELTRRELFYYYFETDTIEWQLNRLLGLHWIRGEPAHCPFVVFGSAAEREAFNAHLLSVAEELLKSPPNPVETHISQRMKEDGNDFAAGPETIGKIVREYLSWRKDKAP